jgi:hypothetical protein
MKPKRGRQYILAVGQLLPNGLEVRIPDILQAEDEEMLVLGHRGAHVLKELVLVLAALLLDLREVHETRPLGLGHRGCCLLSGVSRDCVALFVACSAFGCRSDTSFQFTNDELLPSQDCVVAVVAPVSFFRLVKGGDMLAVIIVGAGGGLFFLLLSRGFGFFLLIVIAADLPRICGASHSTTYSYCTYYYM